jgi:hypothetical protein
MATAAALLKRIVFKIFSPNGLSREGLAGSG